jgi:LacI family transcriptional regulator
MAATIKDIASYTGLSTATVSKGLNGHPLREKNANLIREAAQKLGYKKNKIAWSLKTNRTMTVGVLTPGLENPFHSTITTSIERTLRENGYSTMVVVYYFGGEHCEHNTEREKIDFLLNTRVDGIILFPMNGAADYSNVEWVTKNLPVVLIDTSFSGIACDAVMVDNVQAGYSGIRELVKNGHRRIGIILGPEDHYSPRERLNGCLKALRESGLQIDYRLIKHGDYTFKSGGKMLGELLDMNPSPTAVFATNYDLTIGVMMEIAERNLRIPEDLSVLGFDHFQLSNVFKPRLSLVTQPMPRIGEESAQLLMKRMNGAMDGFPTVHRLEPGLLLRETVRRIESN